MAERRWYRLHWVTWLAVLLVAGAIIRCQFVGESWGLGRNLSTYLGWPFVQVVRTTSLTLLPTGATRTVVEYSWHVPSLLVNGIILLLVVCSTVFTFEAWMRRPIWTQFTIREMLALTGMACCLLTLDRIAVARGVFGLRTILVLHLAGTHYLGPEGFLLRVLVVFGFGCTVFTVGWLVIGLVRGLLGLRHASGRPTNDPL